MEDVCRIAELLANSKHFAQLPGIKLTICIRWYGESHMCVDRQSANCQDMGPRATVIMRHEC